MNQIADISKDMDRSNSIKPPGKGILNKTHKNYTYLGTCWKCGKFGHLAKECKTPCRLQINMIILYKIKPQSILLEIHDMVLQMHKPQDKSNTL